MRPSMIVRLVLWLLLAIASLLASWACVPQQEIVIHYSQSKFNDHIDANLQPITSIEAGADMCSGFFRDGSGDPDENGPRARGMVNEIYPIAASDSSGPGNLVQTPCLFVGRQGSDGDELNLSWEVVATIVPEPGSFLEQLIDPKYPDIGVCTFSGPESRLMFQDDDVELVGNALNRCYGGQGSVALTLNHQNPDRNKNLLNTCPWDTRPAVRLEAFPRRAPNADGVCPALNPGSGFRCGSESFDGTPVGVTVRGGMFDPLSGLISACARPVGFTPSVDASYRVRIEPNNLLDLPVADRFLRPNVLVVDRTRTIVRPMTKSATDFTWHTEVLQRGEGAARWAENFSPTVRVETIQIISRNATGGVEKVETPDQKQLTVFVPRSGRPAPAILLCTGKDLPGGGVTFDMASCSTNADVPGGLTSVTPTYFVGDLHFDPPVTDPITWRAILPGLAADRRAFIRFGLKTQITPPAMSVDPSLDFGEVPDRDYRQATAHIVNVGGETMSVTKIELAPGVGHPQDFSFFVLSDPVPVPLPIDRTQRSDGSVVLNIGDPREVPVATLEERGDSVTVRLGDPALAPGTPQPYTVYNQRTLLRGGFLTRDDPRSAFTPAAGTPPRPFVVPGFVEKRVPFDMRPGERVTVAVETRPSAIGLRLATLRIEAVPVTNPSQKQQMATQLVVDVVSGPLLHYMPFSLSVLEDHNGSQPGHRTGLLENVGHFDLTIHSIQITGPGAARFAVTTDRGGLGPFLLRPGESVLPRVEHIPLCNGNYGTPHQATLLVTSNGGNASIPLFGYSQRFCVP